MTFFKSIVAGLLISIGCIVNVTVGGLAGAILFSVGLLGVCALGSKLFTGALCYRANLPLLPAILSGNIVGAVLAAALFMHSGHVIDMTALCAKKLAETPLETFVLAAFCNVLIFVSVEAYAQGCYIGTIIGVSVFVICGFEHCVANVFYLVSGGWNVYCLAFLLINIIGNFVGGTLISLASGKY